MTRRIVGIGDLHLDGKLLQYAPDLNSIIENEVRSVLLRARGEGVDTAILYGDLCERPVMSDDGKAALSRLFVEFRDMDFLVLKGNHDASDTQACSLDLLAEQVRLGLFPNVTFALNAPVVAYPDTDTPINLLPWPIQDTRADMLNVLHTEASGATWETGRAVDHGIDTKHLCVVGHIHKAQRVRNTHFSGTLYQTSFGEPEEKFFHQIAYTGEPKSTKVRLIRHHPALVLRNVVIDDMDGYRSLVEDCESDTGTPRILRKVFFKGDSLSLPPDAFAGLSSVVKTQGFKSKVELSAMLMEDLVLDDASAAAKWNMVTTLKTWLLNADTTDDTRRRALRKAKELARLSAESSASEHSTDTE